MQRELRALSAKANPVQASNLRANIDIKRGHTLLWKQNGQNDWRILRLFEITLGR